MPEESEILRRLRDCIVDLDIAEVQEACKDALAAGITAYRAVADGLSVGMEIVGQKYEAREYFLSDLMLAGETMKEAMIILQPHFKTEDRAALGLVIIGTVKGDLHDIGKNIAAMLLEAAGFRIVDLGNDVSAKTFLKSVGDYKADILGMSALLTTTMLEMRVVIKEAESAGLRSKFRVIIGGAPISSEFGKDIGADGAAIDAVQGVNLCKTWMTQ